MKNKIISIIAKLDNGSHSSNQLQGVDESLTNLFVEELKKEQANLLLLVINAICDKWDEIEKQDPDKSTQKWMSYKRIRINTRDVITEIAESKGIKL